MNIRALPAYDLGQSFDGIFNKFALNAFWHWDNDEAHTKLVAAIAKTIRPGGWGWIAPWNGIPKKVELDQSTIDRALEFQRALFEGCGFATVPITPRQSAYYGIQGNVANNLVFIKNLEGRPRLWTRLIWF